MSEPDTNDGAPIRSRGPRYHTVVELESYKEPALEALLESRDLPAIVEHLSCWDYGEYEDTPRRIDTLRNYDRSNHKVGSTRYVLLVQYGLGTATLLIECDNECRCNGE